MWRGGRWAVRHEDGCAACLPFVRGAARRYVAGWVRDNARRWKHELLFTEPWAVEADRGGAYAGVSPEDACLREALSEAVMQALEGLPIRQREILRRHYLKRETASRMAADLGLTVGAVEQALHRARLALRRTLEAGSWVV